MCDDSHSDSINSDSFATGDNAGHKDIDHKTLGIGTGESISDVIAYGGTTPASEPEEVLPLKDASYKSYPIERRRFKGSTWLK